MTIRKNLTRVLSLAATTAVVTAFARFCHGR